MATNVIPSGGSTPGEKLYRKLLAEAAEQRWEEALARVAIEREQLAREADEQQWEIALSRALACVAVERGRLAREAELLDPRA
jgi:hypothetical protein